MPEQIAQDGGDTKPTLDPEAAGPLSPEGAGGTPTHAPAGTPRRIGPYEVVAEIGRGGMGVVYKALHPGLKRVVALKVLIAGEDASPDSIARFHREAEAVAKLGHQPHIVPVYDVGLVPGRDGENGGHVHYIAMHFVEGKPLDRKIHAGEISPRKAAGIARKVAEALHQAHEHGVLHRDVKPSNILVTKEGEPQVSDFGLARDVEADAHVTRTGLTLGTPQYMPPEQASGELDKVDARSDVYALGASLYEMLTGRPPFQGATSLHVLKQVMFDDPAPPRRLNPSIPRDLDTICLKALEKPRRRRYGTAREMGEDLERFLKGEPILARPRGPVESAIRKLRRHKIAALTTVFLLAGAAVAAVALWHQTHRPGQLRIKVEGPSEPSLNVDGAPVTTPAAGSPSEGWVFGPLKLPIGAHRLGVALDAFEPQEREFRIEAGGTLEIGLRMERSTGTVTLLSDPENCELELRGPEGTTHLATPLRLHALPTGAYSGVVRKRNHFPVRLSFTVDRGTDHAARKIHLEGMHVWSSPLSGSGRSVAGQGRVVDVDGDGADDVLLHREGASVSCLSGMWGRVLWSRSGRWGLGAMAAGDFNGDRRPDLLLVEGGERWKSRLVCVGCADGREQWDLEFETASDGPQREWFDGAPLAVGAEGFRLDGDDADDFLLLRQQTLSAVSGRTRETIWTTDVRHRGIPVAGDPAGPVGFLCDSSQVTAFELRSGKLLWTERWPEWVGENVLAPGDLDGDGTPDLISWAGNKVFFLAGGEKEVVWDLELGPPDAGFPWRWGIDVDFEFFDRGLRNAGGVQQLKVVPDLDGDGGRDLIVHNLTHKNILTCVSSSSGVKIWDTVIPGPLKAMGDPVDLDGDGAFELPVALGGNRIAVLEGGKGDAVRWVRGGVGLSAWSGTVADFDHDGTLDIVVPADDHRVYAFCGRTGKTLWVYQMDAAVAPVVFSRGTGRVEVGHGAAPGDFDGSGAQQGIVLATERSVVRLRPEPGGGAWSADVGSGPVLAVTRGPEGCRVLSVTGDGRILHVNPTDGRQTFEKRTARGEEGIRDVRLAEYDGDGFLDIYAFDADGYTVDVLSGRDGKALTRLRLPPDATIRAIADLDGDGKPEFLLTPDTEGSLVCIAGASRPGAPTATLWKREEGENGRLSVLALEVFDVDGDGRPEVVTAENDPDREGQGRSVVTIQGPGGEWITRETRWGGWHGMVVRDGRTGEEKAAVQIQGFFQAPRLVDPAPCANPAQIVLIQDDNQVRCVSCAEQKVLWRFPVRGQVMFLLADPTGEVPAVLVGDVTGDLFHLRLEDGQRNWACRLGRPVRRLEFRNAGPGKDRQILVLGSETATLFAPEKREVVWEVTVPETLRYPSAAHFSHLYDLDGNGTEDLLLPLVGGRILGVVPEKTRFEKRPVSFTVEDRLSLGQHMVTTQNYEAAQSWLGEILTSEDIPAAERAQAFRALARSHRQANNNEDALKSLTQALALRPGDAEILAERADLLESQKKLEEAEADFSAALAAPDLDKAMQCRLHIGRGRIRAAVGRHEEALADFDAALAAFPNRFDALTAKASSLHALGRFEEALAVCGTVLERNRWNQQAAILKVRALARLDRPDEAVEALQAAVRVGYRNADYLRDEPDFQSLWKLGRFKELVDGMERGRDEWGEWEED